MIYDEPMKIHIHRMHTNTALRCNYCTQKIIYKPKQLTRQKLYHLAMPENSNTFHPYQTCPQNLKPKFISNQTKTQTWKHVKLTTLKPSAMSTSVLPGKNSLTEDVSNFTSLLSWFRSNNYLHFDRVRQSTAPHSLSSFCQQYVLSCKTGQYI